MIPINPASGSGTSTSGVFADLCFQFLPLCSVVARIAFHVVQKPFPECHLLPYLYITFPTVFSLGPLSVGFSSLRHAAMVGQSNWM